MQVCKKKKQQNGADVNQFLEKYGEKGLRYSCMYDPSNPKRVSPSNFVLVYIFV